MTPILSPYLPGTQIQFAWDSTSLGYIKTCPRLYQYTMLEGWNPKEDSIHLRFGIEYHKALEEYDQYKIAGANHEDSVCEAIRLLLIRIHDWHPDITSRVGNTKNTRTLVQLIIDYLDKFKDDPARTVIRENGKAATEVSFRFELDFGPLTQDPGWDQKSGIIGQPYVLCGHLDRVVNFNDNIFVMDRKTTSIEPSTYYFAQYSPNNQMTLYTLAGQVVLGALVKGVIIDAAQVKLDKPNAYGRGFTFRTPAQLEEWVQDLKIHLHMAEQYATINYWPQNDTACDKFGGCRFRGVCSKDPGVRKQFLKADFNQLPPEERWNPLKPR